MFRIRDILVRIPMQIWSFESGPLPTDPALFVNYVPLGRNKKCLFLSKFLCLFLSEGTFTSFFKDKKVIKKSQNSRNQGVSSVFLLVDGRIRIQWLSELLLVSIFAVLIFQTPRKKNSIDESINRHLCRKYYNL